MDSCPSASLMPLRPPYCPLLPPYCPSSVPLASLHSPSTNDLLSLGCPVLSLYSPSAPVSLCCLCDGKSAHCGLPFPLPLMLRSRRYATLGSCRVEPKPNRSSMFPLLLMCYCRVVLCYRLCDSCGRGLSFVLVGCLRHRGRQHAKHPSPSLLDFRGECIPQALVKRPEQRRAHFWIVLSRDTKAHVTTSERLQCWNQRSNIIQPSNRHADHVHELLSLLDHVLACKQRRRGRVDLEQSLVEQGRGSLADGLDSGPGSANVVDPMLSLNKQINHSKEETETCDRLSEERWTAAPLSLGCPTVPLQSLCPSVPLLSL
jgi:hypothetical protein